jgi:hypothetical protein
MIHQEAKAWRVPRPSYAMKCLFKTHTREAIIQAVVLSLWRLMSAQDIVTEGTCTPLSPLEIYAHEI